MSKFRSARALLAAAAVLALAGCSASTSSSGAPPASSVASSASGNAPAVSSASSGPGATPSTTSNSFVATGSVPFPITVGNTWVYQTTAATSGERGLQTNRVQSVVTVSGVHQVTMAETISLAGTSTNRTEVYYFYPDGAITYPVTSGEVSVPGGGVRWPSAADIASGRAFRSVLSVRVNQAGPVQEANVTVQGLGTHTVTVPAGTYRATLVTMLMSIRVGGLSSIEQIETWDAPGTGPVKSEVLLLAAGHTKVIATNELLTFTKG
jgi:hypothetical protein